MRHLSKRVFAHPTILEMLALGASPPYAACEGVQVTVDLSQVFAKASRKSTLNGYKESSNTLVTALLTSGVGDLVSVIGPPHHLLQDEVVALGQTKLPEEGDDGDGLPHQPVAGLHE
jgi:hypothetical protein